MGAEGLQWKPTEPGKLSGHFQERPGKFPGTFQTAPGNKGEQKRSAQKEVRNISAQKKCAKTAENQKEVRKNGQN